VPAFVLQIQFMRAGVNHIFKQSQWAASPDLPVRFLRYHAAIERKIQESGLGYTGYTFLRPNLFMQGLLAFRENDHRPRQILCRCGRR
jgi:uncharacterized protein YbjT (DUF2867 family)